MRLCAKRFDTRTAVREALFSSTKITTKIIISNSGDSTSESTVKQDEMKLVEQYYGQKIERITIQLMEAEAQLAYFEQEVCVVYLIINKTAR